MLYREKISVLKHKYTGWAERRVLNLVVHIVTAGLWRGYISYIHRSSPYCAVNTLLCYKNQSVNAV